ncbi:MAG: bifunctional phosphopantothenoylcysteine decarboxylase/phosphopantothenate--cysteine ligase CoaBC [Propionibacteriaceae bacterium]|jgi:phosphopantothenoylcysteine decarboxylase/phosphopantothenate--cysteine ligase|nr:bifunctional phosphopantothenoylcysteine decarboxylase/phosphopantothenate--cysteine ligase CoaBC [Propionibacteriaceae bacterium]
MARVVLGVTGGIAAYKACHLVRLFKESGDDVVVVPTANALQFVGAATWEALSGSPVSASVFSDVPNVRHVSLGTNADLVLVAPATADILSRAATGRADDLLTNVLLTASCPLLFAPAMHTQMWLNPATVENVAKLRSYGRVVLEPGSGRLTGKDTGPGRFPEPEDIFATAMAVLVEPRLAAVMSGHDLAGKRVVVSAGGTHEAIDPVRFIGNSSSGKMGMAIARAARARGAEVSVVGANLQIPPTAGIEVDTVRSTSELAEAMEAKAKQADIVVMAAAPADFTPCTRSETKLKKVGDQGLVLELQQTQDVLAKLGKQRRDGQVIVGFAAETASSAADLEQKGRDKLARKGADLLVLNDVSGGRVFGEDTDSVQIIDSVSTVDRVEASKDVVAHHILDCAKGKL